jgi:carbamoyl-phosphate synthase large subunit
MEHIELAGIHSGDSACILPSLNLTPEQVATIKEYTRKIAVEMNVVGLMNMQYAIEDDTVYVLEANPRASRTVPLVSKVCGIKMVPLATDIITAQITGRKSPVADLIANKNTSEPEYYGVKEAVFPFNMFPEVDPVLGPEMRSTGEVLGLAKTPGEAFFKAQEAAGAQLPLEGAVLISLNDEDKPQAAALAKSYSDNGFTIYATGKTYDLISEAGIVAKKIMKNYEGGRPNVEDVIKNGEVQLIINTPIGRGAEHDDGYVRRDAIKARIPYVTTVAAGKAAIEGISEVKKNGSGNVLSLQEYHN